MLAPFIKTRRSMSFMSFFLPGDPRPDTTSNDSKE
jgi:hypothetical protein